MMKKLFNKLLFHLKLLFSGEYDKINVYAKYYKGLKHGKKVRITGKIGFSSEPFLIEIGNNVTLTQNITFHTHDGGVAVLREKYPGINVFGKIKIGNNVFIGSHTIFLPGVIVGNNVVIGAGSVVTKNIPDNSIAVGVPARVIKTLDEYEESSIKKCVFIYEKNSKLRREEILNKLDK